MFSIIPSISDIISQEYELSIISVCGIVSATEIKASKARKYNTVSAIQNNLRTCLDDFVYSLAFYNALTTSGYEFICDFKDSILTDEDTERQRDMQDVSAGIMRPEEYRAKWYGETLETALKNLPQSAQVLD